VGHAALFPMRLDQPDCQAGEQISLPPGVEDLLRRNERLACVGLLAAGIAHEINNPAGSALLAAETALAILDRSDSRDQVAACLRNIVTSMDRCGRIVRTLLRYSREEPTERQACSVNDVAKQTLELARPYAERYGSEVRLELDPNVPLAPMNPLEIELVLVNLVRNAVEAGGEGATVVLRTGWKSGDVWVTVRDDGCGMDPEQLAHVFDALYTTRRESGGCGLGMSIAFGIVQRHGGRMEARSKPGEGTTVAIYLPAADVSSEPLAGESP
jgi:two-component system, NtrC family, sensor kinase